MKRRQWIALLAAGGLGGLAWRFWPDEGFDNPCLPGPLPARLAHDALMQAVWADIDPTQVWDCHVHLLGLGDSSSGVWLNPNMDSLVHPIEYLQKRFYLDASCLSLRGTGDEDYISRLLALHGDFPPGPRLMLLGFDYHYDREGRRVLPLSPFHTPNTYARDVARRYPQRFEWIASVHPYREDCVEALQQAVNDGARAVKWLPSAMGIDPASPLCDRFYEALAPTGIPLLSHAGHEQAVHGGSNQALNNPLRLRRALDHGVRVIVAHCASLGSNTDLDHGANGPRRSNFELFARLMDEPRYQALLFGEISSLAQLLRTTTVIDVIIGRVDWHGRLLYGSDYPLPGVMPIYSLWDLSRRGYITDREARVLSDVRRYNPLLFDFALKRLLKAHGKRLGVEVFHARRVFDPTMQARQTSASSTHRNPSCA